MKTQLDPRVRSLLEALELDRYAESFERFGVRFEDLPNVTEEVLIVFGVAGDDERAVLLRAGGSLRHLATSDRRFVVGERPLSQRPIPIAPPLPGVAVEAPSSSGQVAATLPPRREALVVPAPLRKHRAKRLASNWWLWGSLVLVGSVIAVAVAILPRPAADEITSLDAAWSILDATTAKPYLKWHDALCADLLRLRDGSVHESGDQGDFRRRFTDYESWRLDQDDFNRRFADYESWRLGVRQLASEQQGQLSSAVIMVRDAAASQCSAAVRNDPSLWKALEMFPRAIAFLHLRENEGVRDAQQLADEDVKFIRVNARYGGCEGLCIAHGECVQVGAGQCRALTNDHCKQSDACRDRGACTLRDGSCVEQ